MSHTTDAQQPTDGALPAVGSASAGLRPSHRGQWSGARDRGHRLRRLHRLPSVLRISSADLLDRRLGLSAQSTEALSRGQHLQSARRAVSAVRRAADRQPTCGAAPFTRSRSMPSANRCGGVRCRSSARQRRCRRVLAALAAWGTYATIGGRPRDDAFVDLVRRASDRYVSMSITAWEFARGKLRNDPVYRAAVYEGLLAFTWAGACTFAKAPAHESAPASSPRQGHSRRCSSTSAAVRV